jgi:CHAD domain-containing protein
MAREAASTRIKEQVRAIRTQIPLVAREDEDGIHDMRVASRRLRVCLQEQRELIGPKARKAFVSRVREITRGLGVARELDVSRALLESRRTRVSGPVGEAVSYTLTALDGLRADQSPILRDTLKLVEARSFDTELMRVFETLKARKACYRDSVIAAHQVRYNSLHDQYKAWHKSRSEEELHQIRVGLKQFRYACEQSCGLFGERMNEFIGELKAAQDALGTWNDLRVALEYVHGIVRTDDERAPDSVALLIDALQVEGKVLLTQVEEEMTMLFAPGYRRDVLAFLASPAEPCCEYTRTPL